MFVDLDELTLRLNTYENPFALSIYLYLLRLRKAEKYIFKGYKIHTDTAVTILSDIVTGTGIKKDNVVATLKKMEDEGDLEITRLTRAHIIVMPEALSIAEFPNDLNDQDD